MVLPLCRVMVIGLLAGQMLVAGAFSTSKWPVAPESDIACFTNLVTHFTLNIVAACGAAYGDCLLGQSFSKPPNALAFSHVWDG